MGRGCLYITILECSALWRFTHIPHTALCYMLPSHLYMLPTPALGLGPLRAAVAVMHLYLHQILHPCIYTWIKMWHVYIGFSHLHHHGVSDTFDGTRRPSPTALSICKHCQDYRKLDPPQLCPLRPVQCSNISGNTQPPSQTSLSICKHCQDCRKLHPPQLCPLPPVFAVRITITVT